MQCQPGEQAWLTSYTNDFCSQILSNSLCDDLPMCKSISVFCYLLKLKDFERVQQCIDITPCLEKNGFENIPIMSKIAFQCSRVQIELFEGAKRPTCT